MIPALIHIAKIHKWLILIVIMTVMTAVPSAASDHKWNSGPTSKTIGVPGVKGGVVTTSEPVAAQVGAEVLRQGGNAIDAAG